MNQKKRTKPSKKDHTAAVHTGKPKTYPLNSEGSKYAGAVIKYGECVILAKRIDFCPYSKKEPPYAGHWSVFCGEIEQNETPIQAATRELFEETGIKISEEFFKKIGRIKDLELFITEVKERPKVELNYEHTECGFFKIEYLDSSPNPMDEKVIKMIQETQT